MATPFLTLKTGVDVQPLEFANFEEFKKWTEAWRKEWKWLWEENRDRWSTPVKSYVDMFNTLNAYINSGNQNPNNTVVLTRIEKILRIY